MSEICKTDLDDLKELFKSQIEQVNILINANDKNYNQRFENVIQATQQALTSSDRAVNKAEAAAEKRFEGLNEFREQQKDIIETFARKEEVDIQFRTINEKIDDINQALISVQSKSVGQREGMGTIALISGIIATIVSLISRFL